MSHRTPFIPRQTIIHNGCMSYYLGIDFGTSGARAIAIDGQQQIQCEERIQFDASAERESAEQWRIALFELLHRFPAATRQQIRAIAINGTSSTVLLCDAQGHPIQEPLLYNDARGESVLETLNTFAPSDHLVHSATSSLAKYLWWADQIANDQTGARFSSSNADIYFLHQADWLGFLLHGQLGISDYHNSLKLGYDVVNLCYPNWLQQMPQPFRLPKIVAPGYAIGQLKEAIAHSLQLPEYCQICAGTTDSIAAFLASGARQPGEAVTSLGSTLVLKLLSQTRIEHRQYGIYSHRLGGLWLVGGASNTGGAVLQHYFSNSELDTLSAQIDGSQASLFNYYPLLRPGERFPINDPQFAPQLEPRPDSAVEFLHGLLDGMARIEATGYQLLQKLGATPLTQVYTAGGGAKNLAWTELRSRRLGVPILQPTHTEAAYGTALLALRQSAIL